MPDRLGYFPDYEIPMPGFREHLVHNLDTGIVTFPRRGAAVENVDSVYVAEQLIECWVDDLLYLTKINRLLGYQV